MKTIDAMEILLESDDVELINNSGNFFLSYDAGEIAVQMRELEIDEE